LLTVDKLNVRFTTRDGDVHAVKDLSFSLERGETLGIVGESGSGKSQTVLAMLGLLAANGHVTGSARFDDTQLVGLAQHALRRFRGRRIGIVFQDPMTSLNPYLTVGAQLRQVIKAHESISNAAADTRAVEMLDAVKIPQASARLGRYPHEFSGGMRQRVMIAASLLLRPDVLIADEPTTALDVTVQAQILALMRELNKELGTAIILITHDLGAVAGLCQRLLVMHEGEEKEQGPVEDIFYRPAHAYTRALLAAVPRLDQPSDQPAAPPGSLPDARPLLDVSDLRVRFKVPGRRLLAPAQTLKAVDGVNFQVRPGETVGVVGESGCGKSTLARAILGLVPVASGRVFLFSTELTALTRRAWREHRRDLQIIFQDPLASLNPRMSVGDIVAEPLLTHFPSLSRAETQAQVVAMLERVGLSADQINRYPHEFSGGQCQRIGIARALILKPKLILCDEPVSALDVSIQAQIVRLLMDIQAEMNLTLIFIAHDLAVVRQLSHRVMVMYLGRIVEVAGNEDLYDAPAHPYTRALISAVPLPDPRLEAHRERELLTGELPSPIDPPAGCHFRGRCRYAADRCATEVPPLRAYGRSLVACHLAEQLPVHAA
jgi:oligopeptide/dipeptide ABC transporter ATP-binding protein